MAGAACLRIVAKSRTSSRVLLHGAFGCQDFAFDLIYFNDDNNLENLEIPDDTWKVRMIEEVFHRLMFDTEDV